VKVEELEVDRLYQSVCYDITNLYMCIMEDMAENSVELSTNLELKVNMA